MYKVNFNAESIILEWGDNIYLAPKTEARIKVQTDWNGRFAQLLVQSWPNDIKFFEGGQNTINGLTNPDVITQTFYNTTATTNPTPSTTTTTVDVIENEVTILEPGNWCINVIEGFVKINSESHDGLEAIITHAVFLSANGSHPEIPSGTFPNTLNINTALPIDITGVAKIMVMKGEASFGNTNNSYTFWNGSSF
jgi:hypothetical protein